MEIVALKGKLRSKQNIQCKISRHTQTNKKGSHILIEIFEPPETIAPSSLVFAFLLR